jgi:uncharacterized protein
MKILVDADACPVKNIIVKIAKEFNLPVFMFIDTSHVIDDGYSKVFTVDKARDSADFAIVCKLEYGDIVITQDYGLAAMVLPKALGVINQNGFTYTKDNIDRLLFERHLSQETRRSGGRTKGPRKRTTEDDEKFENCFRRMLEPELHK